MNQQEFESFRNEALALVEELLKTQNKSIQDAMESWTELVGKSEFLSTPNNLNENSVYPHVGDEESRLKRIDFYGARQIKEAWDYSEYQGLLKEKAFIIGHVELLDEFVCATTNFNDGIAIVHHDDLFLTDNLDALVAKEQKYFNCSIIKLLNSLEQGN